ncbi:hypothetical protein CEXT_411401 [Caerostris extrusa]|uniref:Homeobox domain-containing protein n=1 Tax=Caerostris extrusa TaxID=172846 RepID=A0AAV4XAJ2_CAEEX|nr:hypothetical protein CEXT_411401 [Caerostris extrusa]
METNKNTDQDHQQKAKTKRVRTTFTEEQLQVLQANFNLDSNPDGQDLERIAQITGLSKRVTQVCHFDALDDWSHVLPRLWNAVLLVLTSQLATQHESGSVTIP